MQYNGTSTLSSACNAHLIIGLACANSPESLAGEELEEREHVVVPAVSADAARRVDNDDNVETRWAAYCKHSSPSPREMWFTKQAEINYRSKTTRPTYVMLRFMQSK